MRLVLSHFWPALAILPIMAGLVLMGSPDTQSALMAAMGLIEAFTLAVSARAYHLDKRLREEMDADFRRIAARFESRQGSEW